LFIVVSRDELSCIANSSEEDESKVRTQLDAVIVGGTVFAVRQIVAGHDSVARRRYAISRRSGCDSFISRSARSLADKHWTAEAMGNAPAGTGNRARNANRSIGRVSTPGGGTTVVI
jgi:hypothetical protein